MSDKPVLSVVIATYNRCNTLTETLKRLAKQSLIGEKFEVIVVDDDSPDQTREIVNSLIPSMPYSLRYLHHKNQGPGFSQNRGIKAAHSDLIVMIVEDIWVTPQFLEQHLKTHTEYPQLHIAVLGKVLKSSQLPPTIMHKYWDPFRYDVLEGKHELDSVYFFGCNISFKKQFFLENGMFRHRGAIAHEDIELGYRLGQKGLRIIYNKDALAYHFHPETLEGACQRAYERGRNFDVLSENIPKSYIFPLYHIFTLQAGLWGCLKMLPREIVRRILFNRFTVNSFWIKILNYAEANPVAALFASNITFRGTVNYHMRLGFNDLKKKRNKALHKTVSADFEIKAE